jgi:hypothetical protein
LIWNRYVIEPVDEAIALMPNEESGLEKALDEEDARRRPARRVAVLEGYFTQTCFPLTSAQEYPSGQTELEEHGTVHASATHTPLTSPRSRQT